MRAKLYQNSNGYTFISGKGKMFSIAKEKPHTAVFCGQVSESYIPTGTLLKSIPNQLKRKFFELVKES